MKYEREDRMVRVYRHRDKKKFKSVCDFNDSWLFENITSKACFYCGSTKELGSDRKDNSLGHTKNNIIPCCKRCNQIKNNFFSVEEFKKVVDFCKENNIVFNIP